MRTDFTLKTMFIQRTISFIMFSADPNGCSTASSSLRNVIIPSQRFSWSKKYQQSSSPYSLLDIKFLPSCFAHGNPVPSYVDQAIDSAFIPAVIIVSTGTCKGTTITPMQNFNANSRLLLSEAHSQLPSPPSSAPCV